MMLKNAISLILVCAIAAEIVQALPQRQPNGRNSNSPSARKPKIVLTQKDIAAAIQGLAVNIASSEWALGNKGNVLQSPISIGSLLNLLLLGTDGESHTELKKALGYPNSFLSSSIHENYRNMLQTSFGNQVEGVKINMDSGLFLQNKAPFQNLFIENALKFYGSQSKNLDFSRDPVGSTDYINRWVNKTTYGKIAKVFDVPLPPFTTFIAANTIYFNGGWEGPFPKALTYDRLFMTGRKNISIPMMSNDIVCNYISDSVLGFDMISLPYKGRNHAMYILTPKGDPDINTLHKIESSLDFDKLDRLIKQMKPSEVSISIPRMRLRHKMDLKDNLKLLGVKKIFNKVEADFSKLTSVPEVNVDSVLHDAVLEVTESGTIAAAVTLIMINKSLGRHFTFNRPSLLFIRDERNGAILFWARVVEPEPIYLPA